MPLDLHTHYLPTELVEALRARSVPPFIERAGNGAERLIMPVGTLAFSDAYTDMVARIAFMDRVGVDMQVLSLPGLFGIDSLPLAEAGPLVRLFNDDVARLCRREPGRFLGLAALPLAEMAAAVAELERAMGHLGLIGAILPVNAFADTARAAALAPVLEAGSRLGAHFFIHPGRRPDEVPNDPSARAVPPEFAMLRAALRVQAAVAEAMVTLLFSDLLDDYPGLTLHVANLGGTLPNVIERMDHTYRTRLPDEPLPSERCGQVHVDCSSLGPLAIEAAVRVYGADKIVFGTDCPIFDTQISLDAVRAAAIPEDARKALLDGNARSLLARFLP